MNRVDGTLEQAESFRYYWHGTVLALSPLVAFVDFAILSCDTFLTFIRFYSAGYTYKLQRTSLY